MVSSSGPLLEAASPAALSDEVALLEALHRSRVDRLVGDRDFRALRLECEGNFLLEKSPRARLGNGFLGSSIEPSRKKKKDGFSLHAAEADRTALLYPRPHRADFLRAQLEQSRLARLQALTGDFDEAEKKGPPRTAMRGVLIDMTVELFKERALKFVAAALESSKPNPPLLIEEAAAAAAEDGPAVDDNAPPRPRQKKPPPKKKKKKEPATTKDVPVHPPQTNLEPRERPTLSALRERKRASQQHVTKEKKAVDHKDDCKSAVPRHNKKEKKKGADEVAIAYIAPAPAASLLLPLGLSKQASSSERRGGAAALSPPPSEEVNAPSSYDLEPEARVPQFLAPLDAEPVVESRAPPVVVVVTDLETPKKRAAMAMAMRELELARQEEEASVIDLRTFAAREYAAVLEPIVTTAATRHVRVRRFALSTYAALREAAVEHEAVTTVHEDEEEAARRALLVGEEEAGGSDNSEVADDVSSLWLRLEMLWEELRIPTRDRDLIRAQRGYGAPEVASHLALLLRHRAMTRACLGRIDLRERALGGLQRLAASAKIDVAADVRCDLLRAVAAATRDVFAAVQDWHADLWLPLPFTWRGRAYVSKMATDAAAYVRHDDIRVLDDRTLHLLLPTKYRPTDADPVADAIADEGKRVADLRADVQAQLMRGNFTPTLRWSPTNANTAKDDPDDPDDDSSAARHHHHHLLHHHHHRHYHHQKAPGAAAPHNDNIATSSSSTGLALITSPDNADGGQPTTRRNYNEDQRFTVIA